MKRRTIIEIISAVILLSIGWMIGNKWQIAACELELKFNIVDVLTLIVTIAMGLYIARVLEKDVQDKRIEKDMYLSKINVIESICDELENKFQASNGKGLDYKEIVNLEHRIKTKKNTIFKYILDNSHGKINDKLKTHDEKLKGEFKDLRNNLTQTTVGEVEQQDIEIVNNCATYSNERTTCILSSLNTISNSLLEVKVLVNKM